MIYIRRCFYFGVSLMEENIYFIDLLGRWVDDSRVADRNHRLSSNGRCGFCSNRVVNITTPTFILSANFGSYNNQTIKSFRSTYRVGTRISAAGEGHQITAKSLNSSLNTYC